MTERVTVDGLRNRAAGGEKIVALTAYDHPTAQILDAAGVDLLFVGDSVGTNCLGYTSEREVTLDDIVHHLQAVRRGVVRAAVLADLPFGTYDDAAVSISAARRLTNSGADIVKLEGGVAKEAIIRAIVVEGIAVCGHVGFTPQTLYEPGKKGRVQGRSREEAESVIADAVAVEQAGAAMIVLELIPESLAQVITERLTIPTIGIGAGRFCSGQVLIANDVLGLGTRKLRLAKQYVAGRELFLAGVSSYVDEVRRGAFPAAEHGFAMDAGELPQ